MSLLLGLLGGCRPHVTVCDSDCDEVSASASAHGGAADVSDSHGVDAGMGGRPFGEAGAAGAASGSCSEDAECDDGVFCNGAERCQRGACEQGAAVTCNDGTTCAEQEDAAKCVYLQPSPWLLLLTNRQVVGLPTAELGKRPMLTLGERPSDDVFIGFNDVAFSPDGRHALIDYLVPDLAQQVLELTFDAGVPQPVARVKNLPNVGTFSTPAFSRDGARALLFDSGSGAYLLDLSAPAAVPAKLTVPGFLGSEITFCQTRDAWVKASSPSTLYSLVSGEPVATELGGEAVAVSPDGLWVWMRGDNARVATCGPDLKLGPTGLPDAGGTWSPDSRWLLASLDDGSAKVFSVSAALETTEVWSNDALGASTWSADGHALLVRLDGGAEPRFAYLDLTGEDPVEEPIDLASDASINSCSAEGCLAFVPTAAGDEFDLFWQLFAANTAPTLLAAHLSSDNAVAWADFAGHRLLLRRSTATGNQLTLTDFQASPEQVVFDWPEGSADVRPASDGSGVLVQRSDDVSYSNFWLALPTRSGADATVVPLDVPAYRSAFQPWPRQAP